MVRVAAPRVAAEVRGVIGITLLCDERLVDELVQGDLASFVVRAEVAVGGLVNANSHRHFALVDVLDASDRVDAVRHEFVDERLRRDVRRVLVALPRHRVGVQRVRHSLYRGTLQTEKGAWYHPCEETRGRDPG